MTRRDDQRSPFDENHVEEFTWLEVLFGSFLILAVGFLLVVIVDWAIGLWL